MRYNKSGERETEEHLREIEKADGKVNKIAQEEEKVLRNFFIRVMREEAVDVKRGRIMENYISHFAVIRLELVNFQQRFSCHSCQTFCHPCEVSPMCNAKTHKIQLNSSFQAHTLTLTVFF